MLQRYRFYARQDNYKMINIIKNEGSRMILMITLNSQLNYLL